MDPSDYLQRVVRQGRPAELLALDQPGRSTTWPARSSASWTTTSARRMVRKAEDILENDPPLIPVAYEQIYDAWYNRVHGQNPSTFFGIYDVVRWDNVWMALRALGAVDRSCGSTWRAGQCSPLVTLLGVSLIIFVDPPHPAGRSARGHPRRGGPRQDDAGRSRAHHGRPRPQRPAARAVRPLARATSPPAGSASRSSAATPWPS